jgi:hypothetical protein
MRLRAVYDFKRRANRCGGRFGPPDFFDSGAAG